MRNPLRRRFWLETGLAIVTGIMFVITLIRRDWIELIFNIDPDQGNGSLERLLVGALLVVTISLFALATYEWRRTRVTAG